MNIPEFTIFEWVFITGWAIFYLAVQAFFFVSMDEDEIPIAATFGILVGGALGFLWPMALVLVPLWCIGKVLKRYQSKLRERRYCR